MKILKNLFLITIICQLTLGCAVQKRRYTKGYHFSVRSKPKQTKNSTVVSQNGKQTKINEPVIASPVLLATEDSENNLPEKIHEKHFGGLTQNFSCHAKQEPQEKAFVFSKKTSSTKHIKQSNGNGGGINIAGLFGFVFSLLMVASFIGGISTVISGGYSGVFIGAFVLGLSLALAALAFLLSLIGIIIKIRNPEKRGNWMAVVGLVLSSILLLFVLVLFL